MMTTHSPLTMEQHKEPLNKKIWRLMRTTTYHGETLRTFTKIWRLMNNIQPPLTIDHYEKQITDHLPWSKMKNTDTDL